MEGGRRSGRQDLLAGHAGQWERWIPWWCSAVFRKRRHDRFRLLLSLRLRVRRRRACESKNLPRTFDMAGLAPVPKGVHQELKFLNQWTDEKSSLCGKHPSSPCCDACSLAVNHGKIGMGESKRAAAGAPEGASGALWGLSLSPRMELGSQLPRHPPTSGGWPTFESRLRQTASDLAVT